jgi:hypothetical protein
MINSVNWLCSLLDVVVDLVSCSCFRRFSSEILAFSVSPLVLRAGVFLILCR